MEGKGEADGKSASDYYFISLHCLTDSSSYVVSKC